MEERGEADCILLVLVSQFRPIFQWHMHRSDLQRLSQNSAWSSAIPSRAAKQ